MVTFVWQPIIKSVGGDNLASRAHAVALNQNVKSNGAELEDFSTAQLEI
jgi:hypothetical protein